MHVMQTQVDTFLPHNAMLARYMPLRWFSSSVCLSDGLSSQCSTETVKYRIMQITSRVRFTVGTP